MRQLPERNRGGHMPAGRSGSGGGVEGHRVAESLQFPNVVTDSALGVGAGGVVLRSEVEEVSVLVGEQGPDDHENGPADGDDGPLLAAASGDPPIPLPEEGVRAAGTDRGLAEDSGQVAVAVPGAGMALLAAGGLTDPRGE